MQYLCAKCLKAVTILFVLTAVGSVGWRRVVILGGEGKAGGGVVIHISCIYTECRADNVATEATVLLYDRRTVTDREAG